MAMAREREWGTFDRAARAQLLDFATRLPPIARSRAHPVAARGDDGVRERAGRGAGRAAIEAASERATRGGAQASLPGVDHAADREPVTAEDIEVAWRERRERAGRAERHIREITLRGEVALETERLARRRGQRALRLQRRRRRVRPADAHHGGRRHRPRRDHRRRARGAARRGIHTKGVAILRGYLGAHVRAGAAALSLRAQLAFEQSYGEIDGDSASSSELFAVLSALADVGIDQGVAVTGSVNQLGEMQAIGGVCAKIEGFFDLCKARGLTGTQGVLVPAREPAAPRAARRRGRRDRARASSTCTRSRRRRRASRS